VGGVKGIWGRISKKAVKFVGNRKRKRRSCDMTRANLYGRQSQVPHEFTSNKKRTRKRGSHNSRQGKPESKAEVQVRDDESKRIVLRLRNPNEGRKYRVEKGRGQNCLTTRKRGERRRGGRREDTEALTSRIKTVKPVHRQY